MTTHRPKSTLQDEFLADLRVAAPIPVTPPKGEPAKAEAPAPRQAAPQADETPTIQLRVTPWRWSRPSVAKLRQEGQLMLSAGPLQISLTGAPHR